MEEDFLCSEDADVILSASDRPNKRAAKRRSTGALWYVVRSLNLTAASSAERSRNVVVGGIQLSPNAVDRHNNSDRNSGRDEGILDGGGARVVLPE
jgi:hypothetical protein